MQLVPENTSVVIAGVWNPAILNPTWILRHVLELPEGTVEQIQIEQPFIPSGVPPSYSIAGLTFTPGRNQLVIRPLETSVDTMVRVQNIAIRILTLLSHTPLSAFGQNFEFLELTPLAEQLMIFGAANDLAQHCDFQFDTLSTQVSSSIQFDDRQLNLSRSNTNGILSLKFNFHYPVASAEIALQKFQNPIFQQNLEYTLRIIRSLYGIEPNLQSNP